MQAPSGFGDGKLLQLSQSVWTATTPIRFFGTWFPHVMSVVKLSDQSLLVHSPCHPSPELVEAIEVLGRVAHVVAPNWFHDLYLRAYRALFPEATFWGPRFLKAQHPALLDKILDVDPTPWFGEMPHVSLRGLLTFDESVFYHRASGTAIVADFLMNACADGHAPAFTKLGYALFGLRGQLTVFPVLRWFGIAHRNSMRNVAASLLAWQPERLIVGHGRPIRSEATSQLARALEWLV